MLHLSPQHNFCCIVVVSQLKPQRRPSFSFANLRFAQAKGGTPFAVNKKTKRKPQPQATTVGCGLWTYAAGGTPAAAYHHKWW